MLSYSTIVIVLYTLSALWCEYTNTHQCRSIVPTHDVRVCFTFCVYVCVFSLCRLVYSRVQSRHLCSASSAIPSALCWRFCSKMMSSLGDCILLRRKPVPGALTCWWSPDCIHICTCLVHSVFCCLWYVWFWTVPTLTMSLIWPLCFFVSCLDL